MSENLFLRIPANTAKAQLKKRIDVYIPDIDISNYHTERAQWSQLNIAVLESIFSTSRVADDYRKCVERALEGGKFTKQTHKNVRDFLRQLMETIEAFPELPAQAGIQSA